MDSLTEVWYLANGVSEWLPPAVWERDVRWTGWTYSYILLNLIPAFKMDLNIETVVQGDSLIVGARIDLLVSLCRRECLVVKLFTNRVIKPSYCLVLTITFNKKQRLIVLRLWIVNRKFEWLSIFNFPGTFQRYYGFLFIYSEVCTEGYSLTSIFQNRSFFL